MPIDAQVRPLPSDDTTPPVTKMCLHCRGGVIAARSLSSTPIRHRAFTRPTSHYTRTGRGPTAKEAGGRGSGGRTHLSFSIQSDELFVIFEGVDADGRLFHHADVDAAAE